MHERINRPNLINPTITLTLLFSKKSRIHYRKILRMALNFSYVLDSSHAACDTCSLGRELRARLTAYAYLHGGPEHTARFLPAICSDGQTAIVGFRLA